jgi:hypothetical protein
VSFRYIGQPMPVVEDRRFVRGRGRVAASSFVVDLRRGQGKVSFGGVFRSLHVSSVRYSAHAARITGTGLFRGVRVSFAAVAVDHGATGDVFRIAWRHGAAHGGLVRRGFVTIK